MNITVEQLVKLGATNANATKYVEAINQTCDKFNINTVSRVCMFLAQIFEESGNLSVVKENLYYGKSERLMQVWPARFPTLASTNGCVMNPEGLANHVYGGRGGNNLDEGYKFSGKGLIQVTFKANYEACGKALGIDLVSNPDLLLQPLNAALSAGWYWNKTNCNAHADLDSEEGMREVTKIVNGGYGNLPTRLTNWHKAKTIFNNIESVKPIENVSLEIPRVAEVTENPIVLNEVSAVNEVKPNLLALIISLIMKIFKKK